MKYKHIWDIYMCLYTWALNNGGLKGSDILHSNCVAL